MAIYLSNRDGDGKTNEEGHYKFQTFFYDGNVATPNDLKVTQNDPANLTVLVAPGQYKIDNSTYSYTGWIDTSTSVTITSPSPSNPRYDVVVLYVDKAAATSAVPPNNPGVAKLAAVAGAPASTPIVPSGATIQSAVGAGNPYIILAQVYVGTSTTQITDSNIIDMREPVKLSDYLLNSQSLLQSVGPLLYPVGSIYINATNSLNPGSLLGFGTWSLYGEGRVIVGVAGGDSDFGSIGQMGGAKSVTLTEAQMPQHSHAGNTSSNGSHSHNYYGPPDQIVKPIHGSGDWAHGFNDGGKTRTTDGVGHHSHSFTTDSKGSGQAHTNLQPYITAYIWRRTA